MVYGWLQETVFFLRSVDLSWYLTPTLIDCYMVDSQFLPCCVYEYGRLVSVLAAELHPRLGDFTTILGSYARVAETYPDGIVPNVSYSHFTPCSALEAHYTVILTQPNATLAQPFPRRKLETVSLEVGLEGKEVKAHVRNVKSVYQ